MNAGHVNGRLAQRMGSSTPLYEGAEENLALSANGLESRAIKGNKDFQDAYLAAGGANATFQFHPRATTRGRTGARSCKPSSRT
jgi:hypothetical protein